LSPPKDEAFEVAFGSSLVVLPTSPARRRFLSFLSRSTLRGVKWPPPVCLERPPEVVDSRYAWESSSGCTISLKVAMTAEEVSSPAHAPACSSHLSPPMSSADVCWPPQVSRVVHFCFFRSRRLSSCLTVSKYCLAKFLLSWGLFVV
jgi:hypothetical protein